MIGGFEDRENKSFHPENNVSIFNITSLVWTTVKLQDEEEKILSRSNFGFCQKDQFVYITGGVRKFNDEFQSLPIDSLGDFKFLLISI